MCTCYQLKEAQLREKRLQQENTTWEMQMSQLTFEIKQLSEQVCVHTAVIDGCPPSMTHYRLFSTLSVC